MWDFVLRVSKLCLKQVILNSLLYLNNPQLQSGYRLDKQKGTFSLLQAHSHLNQFIHFLVVSKLQHLFHSEQ